MRQPFDKVFAYLGEEAKAGMLRQARGDAAVLGHRELRAPRLKSSAVKHLAMQLDVPERIILTVVDISERAYSRRRYRHELLTEAQSDRLLRIARVASEAEEVFGDLQKSRRWLTTNHPLLGAMPLELLGFDAGTREVEEELVRINFGDFA